MSRGVVKALSLSGVVCLVGCGVTTDGSEIQGDEAVTGGGLQERLSGAIFTTTVDGVVVNENVRYEAREDVYLDGGPGPQAPVQAAGLPAGDYYFQVTDPSGKDLLSSDHIDCRRVRVNAAGVIDLVYVGQTLAKVRGTWTPVACQHNQGIDADHSEAGAITVQLFPYDLTPNPGGVYKVWLTPVDRYAGDPNLVPGPGVAVNGENWQPGNVHGFVPAWSKTDNYKVRVRGRQFVSPTLSVRKFHDANLNGVQDAGEEEIVGWAIDITDPLGVTNVLFTPALVDAAAPGVYRITEAQPAGSMVTVSTLDAAVVSLYPTAGPTVSATVAGTSEETHAIVFGNVGVGLVQACKVFDRNGNGRGDAGEPFVAGWPMSLEGIDVRGTASGPITQLTGANGCTVFADLLPGQYTVAEGVVAGWSATAPVSSAVLITSQLAGATLNGSAVAAVFENICFETADFGTKGYWHNKNGLSELTWPDIDAVNALPPYGAASSYFGAGDEPFDGLFSDGSPVAAAEGVLGDVIAPVGSWAAEVSQFLVDTNQSADPREQLGQQLLAFIFNVQHRLDDPGAFLQLSDGSLATAESLIVEGIAAWLGADPVAQHTTATLLDGFNNGDAVPFVPVAPCAVVYP